MHGHAATHGKTEDEGAGIVFGVLAEDCPGCQSIFIKVGDGCRTGAVACSGVIEYEGGYTLFVEQLLGLNPHGDGFADAVKDEYCGSIAIGCGHPEGVECAGAAGYVQARIGHCGHVVAGGRYGQTFFLEHGKGDVAEDKHRDEE